MLEAEKSSSKGICALVVQNENPVFLSCLHVRHERLREAEWLDSNP